MFSVPRDIGFAEARRLIDEEYRNCEKRLLLLGSQRNTFTDIARIPDEILLETFSVLKAESTVAQWFCITQVCRHWRGVSIYARKLWTDPPTHLQNLTLLFLERSMPLCLDIYFDVHRKTSTDTMVAILNHIRRVQTLKMGQVELEALQRIQKTLMQSNYETPNLKELFISPRLSSHDERYRLSASTFRGAPFLQKLCLQYVDLDWTMFPLPNLTSLALARVDISIGLSWGEFLKTLGAMPLLESIQVNFGELRLHTPSTLAEMMSLPRLSKLSISGASETQIRYFISKATLPLLDKAHIVCTTRGGKEDDIPTIQALSSLIEEGNFGTLDAMRVGWRGSFLLWQHSDPFNEKFIFSNEQCIKTEHETLQIIANSLLRISSLNYAGVSTLVHAYLYSYGKPSDNDMINLFAGLPLLESITLCDEMAIPFTECLFIPLYTPATGEIPFANLKVISFFERHRVHFCPELFHKLLTCLMQRCEYDAPIEELCISWTLTEEELNVLKGIVVDVDIDEYYRVLDVFW